jgi:hypothetical protein
VTVWSSDPEAVKGGKLNFTLDFPLKLTRFMASSSRDSK